MDGDEEEEEEMEESEEGDGRRMAIANDVVISSTRALSLPGGALPGRLQKYRDALLESEPRIEDRDFTVSSSFASLP